ncbi:hypothetical protein SAICODRAFT_54524 [Saitoella complicata NRRL Y-17804]|nr:uncharacterized protein SAICODRAFT_54524 [Saitoella complicata NRRL Y-17804]ODQ54458.1 hypothetical protein SAICODRAFT_54524 [Saitoella complicata NRRL Y-17804]
MERSDPEPFDPLKFLPDDSLTACRLQHAHPNHLHATTRRVFIGPVPKGWVQHHRKSWYGSFNYHKKAASFTLDETGGLHEYHSRQGCQNPSPLAPRQSSETEDDMAIIPPDEHEQSDQAPARLLPTPIQSGEGRRTASNMSGQSFRTAAESFADVSGDSESDQDEDGNQSWNSNRATSEAEHHVQQFRTLSVKQSTLPSAMRSHLKGGTVQKVTRFSDSVERPELSLSAPSSRVLTERQPTYGSDTSLLPHETISTQSPSSCLLSPRKDRSIGVSQKSLVRFETGPGQNPALEDRSEVIASISKRFRNPFRRQKQQGEILKLDKMLLRIAIAPVGELPVTFDEHTNNIEVKTFIKWREYLVVARAGGKNGATATIKIHKNRVIPAMDKSFASRHSEWQIPLDSEARVNLYSHLDKSLCIWRPYKNGTIFYILRPNSVPDSIEWYGFIQQCLGSHPARYAHIHVPDLDVSFRVALRSNATETGNTGTVAATGALDEAGNIIAANGRIITPDILTTTCLNLLEQTKEWEDVLKYWKANEKLGLCWKRYDRVEWIHGSNGARLIGQWTMARTHQIELRPKTHYPTRVHVSRSAVLEEPEPVEGFLVRLSSARGRHARLGRMFYKRLYFSTHDHLMFFSKPGRAHPPPPPEATTRRRAFVSGGNTPSPDELLSDMPLIYNIAPYDVASKDGEISWLNRTTSREEILHRDAAAKQEAERLYQSIKSADGYIDLTRVQFVRRCRREPAGVDADVGRGESVPFNEDGSDDTGEDGVVGEFDDDRTFEMVLLKGLVLRLQAYNRESRNEWIRRLNLLITYWKARLAQDLTSLKQMRESNLKLLGIELDQEGTFGQSADKWEVSRSITNPELYNFCPISSCRAITMRGVLFRKMRKNVAFDKFFCLITQGELLIYHHVYRSSGGSESAHIHHELHARVGLRDAYVYSGASTQGLLQSESVAVPRIYKDGWQSQDEETMLTFVVWQGRRRKVLSRNGDNNARILSSGVRSVSRLGVAGKGTIFKTRSRQERDMWVTALQLEIERMSEEDRHIRITG